MNSPPHHVTHEWVRARIGPWAAGILDENEQASFHAHIETCDACRKAAGEISRRTASVQGHIPSSLLASWNQRAPLLTGKLRELVREHLEACPDCRRELETLGFDPGLIRE